MNGTTTRRRKPTKKKKNLPPLTDLSPILRTITLAEARRDLNDLADTRGVIPASALDTIATALDSLLTKAQHKGITNLDQLMTQQASLLVAITGESGPTRMHPSKTAEPLHLHRNVMIALAAASAAANGCSASVIFANAIALEARSAHPVRPLTGDEIFLMRVHASLAPTGQAAGVYAMADAGLWASEITSVSLSSFIDPQTPAQILAPGHGRDIASRFLTLDQFGGTILGAHTHKALAAGLHRDCPLVYRPRTNQPATDAATASMHGVLIRMLEEVGLRGTDVTAASITQWRIKNLFDDKGLEHAAEFAGRNNDQLTGFLYRDKSQQPTRTPRVTRFEID